MVVNKWSLMPVLSIKRATCLALVCITASFINVITVPPEYLSLFLTHMQKSLEYEQHYVVKCCWQLWDTSSVMHVCLVYVLIWNNLPYRDTWHAGTGIKMALTFTQEPRQLISGSPRQHPHFWHLPSWSSSKQLTTGWSRNLLEQVCNIVLQLSNALLRGKHIAMLSITCHRGAWLPHALCGY